MTYTGKLQLFQVTAKDHGRRIKLVYAGDDIEQIRGFLPCFFEDHNRNCERDGLLDFAYTEREVAYMIGSLEAIEDAEAALSEISPAFDWEESPTDSPDFKPPCYIGDI